LKKNPAHLRIIYFFLNRMPSLHVCPFRGFFPCGFTYFFRFYCYCSWSWIY